MGFVQGALDDPCLSEALRAYGLAASALADCYDANGRPKRGASPDARRNRYDAAVSAVMASIHAYGARCLAEGQRRAR